MKLFSVRNSFVFSRRFLCAFATLCIFFFLDFYAFSEDVYYRWTPYTDSSGTKTWDGIWSDTSSDSGTEKSKFWSWWNGTEWEKTAAWGSDPADYPGSLDWKNAYTYFTGENAVTATLNADLPYSLKELYIGDCYSGSSADVGSDLVTINLAGYALKTEKLILGNSSFGTSDSVNFTVTGGGTLTVSDEMTFAAGCTYDIQIGADTVLDVAAFSAAASGATINFSGEGTLKLGTAAFSAGKVNLSVKNLEVSGAATVSESAAVNFTGVSSAVFSGEVSNSGEANFSGCQTVSFGGGFTNSGTSEFSGAAESTVSGKITNSGKLTLGHSAKTTFRGGLENLATGELLCNETAETVFSGEFTNQGTAELSGSAKRTFGGTVENSGNSGKFSVNGSAEVVFEADVTNSGGGEAVFSDSAVGTFSSEFTNSLGGTLKIADSAKVTFSGDFKNSATADFEDCTSATITFNGNFTNSAGAAVTLPGSSGSSVTFGAATAGAYSNLGTVYSSGVCALSFAADVTDGGTWIYSGGTPSGTVKNDGITYNILELKGNIVIPGDLTATKKIIVKTDSLNIQGTIKSGEIEIDTEKAIVLDADATVNAGSVALLQNTSFDANGKNLVFGAAGDSSSVTSSDQKNLVVSDSSGTGGGKAVFYSSLGTEAEPLGKITAGAEISFNADVYAESIDANSAAQISSAKITTTDGQAYSSTVTTSGTNTELVSKNGNLSFAGAATLGAETTVSSGGDVAFSGAVDISAETTISAAAGSVSFSKDLTSTAKLEISAKTSATFSGTTTLGAETSVTSDGEVAFSGAVETSAETSVTAASLEFSSVKATSIFSADAETTVFAADVEFSDSFSVSGGSVKFSSNVTGTGAGTISLQADTIFSGNSTVSLESGTFSVGSESDTKTTTVSESAAVNFTGVSSAVFSGEVSNSGEANFSGCQTVSFGGGFTNSGTSEFSGAAESTVSGKITNSGKLTLGHSAKTTFRGGLENLATGELLCNETAETVFSGEFTNQGTAELSGSAKRTFGGTVENSGNSGKFSVNGSAEVVFEADVTNSGGGEAVFSDSAVGTFSSEFTNSLGGTLKIADSAKVTFSGDFKNSATADFEDCTSATITFNGNFTNSAGAAVTLPGSSGSSVTFGAATAGAYSNLGTVYSSGVCALSFAADVTDGGTWIYSGGTPSGTVKNDGITYNILELKGNIVIPGDLTATKKIIVKTDSLNIQGTIKSGEIEIDTEKAIVLDADATVNAGSVALLQNTSFDANGKNLVFGAAGDSSSVTSSDQKNLVVSDSSGTGGGKAVFYSSLGTEAEPLGKITAGAEISFNADVYAESIKANSAAQISSAKITTTNGQAYSSTVTTSGTKTELVSKNGNLSFAGAATLGAETTVSSGGDVAFSGAVETSAAAPFSVIGSKVTFSDTVTALAEFSVKAVSGTVVFEKSLTLGNNFSAAVNTDSSTVWFKDIVNSTSKIEVSAKSVCFDSELVTTGEVSLLADVYFSGVAKDEIKIETEKIIVGSKNLEKNLYISALSLSGDSAKNVEWNAPSDISGNFILLNGNLTLGKNSSGKVSDISALKDIVFLNGNSSTMYDDTVSTEFDWRSGAKNIFKYRGEAELPGKFPDGTEISSEKFYSSLAGLGGNTISAGQNFYCNGVNLEGGSEWNLKAGDNEKSENFAVAYNSSIKNCAYSSSGSGISYFAAGETTDNGGNNGNVCFGHPEISFARTVYDDVVEVSFKDSVSGNSVKIENSNNEIWNTFAGSSKFLTYENDGEKICFDGTYVDAECTETTENQGDLEKFYLKAPKTWNTDATGKSSGAAQSTDMNGNYRSSIPYLNIVRAVSDDFSGLLDEHKNRIADYDGEKRFVDVTDSCPPVLIAVRTGQELHAELPANQTAYDSHNFLEFQYSEEIFADKNDSSALNVQSSANFGGMENNSSGSGFVVAGLVQFEKGKISLGSESGVAAEKLNSLYRNFTVSASKADSPQNQTHRFRISLAGYQSQSAVENSSGFPYWPGYIDSENTQIPSGKITQLSFGQSGTDFNDFIKDSEGNSLLVKSKENHELQTLSVISDSEEDSFEPDWSDSVYGSWDLSAPVFALFRPLKIRNSSERYEILGACKTSGTVLERIEFHVFDNSDDFFENLGAEWYSQFGWGKNNSELFMDDSYASDIFGGSRPFGNCSGDSARTSGGIRYSTLYNKSSYFKYGIDEASPEQKFKDSTIKSGASSALFVAQTGSKREISSNDSLYFSVFLEDGTNLPLKTNFSIKYDEKACVTDLAGNLMKSADVKSVDRVSPRFNMTSAKISGNKLYVVFNKELNLDAVDLESSDGTVKSFKIADSLRFITIPENSHKFNESEDVVSDLCIETDISPQKTFSSSTFTGLVFTLNRNVTLEDVKNYYIQCYSPDSGKFVDPFTGISDVKVTSVTDVNGNYMDHGEAHALSDFAVNAVNPVYAYDDRFLEENFGFSVSDAEQSNLAVHDWNEDQKNDGTLMTEHDIFVVTSQDSGNSGSEETLPQKIIMYYDNAPDSDSVSSEYNKNLEENLRVWIPSAVPYGDDSGTSVENVSPISALAPSVNSANLFVAGEIDKNIGKFVLGWETLNKNGYSSGNQVSFLFGLADSDGIPVKICHAPAYDEISGIYKIEMQPLFALRLKNAENPASLDLWSFKLKNTTLQRGNVTVFNNVIDANQGEMSVIQVNMPSEGKLDVIVMTLDGNVIRYLQHGTASAGEHSYSWNGTTKSGKKVARGLYFVRVFGNGIDETRKIMVVKN